MDAQVESDREAQLTSDKKNQPTSAAAETDGTGEQLSQDSVIVESFVADLIPWFMENRHKDVETLEAALAKGDLEVARQMGHTLKGTSGGYGFMRLSELGAQLEFESRHNNLARAKEIVQQMREHLSRVRIIYNP